MNGVSAGKGWGDSGNFTHGLSQNSFFGDTTVRYCTKHAREKVLAKIPCISIAEDTSPGSFDSTSSRKLNSVFAQDDTQQRVYTMQSNKADCRKPPKAPHNFVR